MRQGVDACDMGQIKCDLLDGEVLELFRGITADPALIQKFVKAEAPADVPDLKAAQARVSACERKIGRLAASLALAEDSAASKYIIAEMERLDVELGALKREASLAEMESHQAADSWPGWLRRQRKKRDCSRCDSGVYLGRGAAFY